MAYIVDEYCAACEKVTTHCNGKCAGCRDRENRARIAVWNSKTVEEKLQELRERVERLEQGPGQY